MTDLSRDGVDVAVEVGTRTIGGGTLATQNLTRTGVDVTVEVGDRTITLGSPPPPPPPPPGAQNLTRTGVDVTVEVGDRTITGGEAAGTGDPDPDPGPLPALGPDPQDELGWEEVYGPDQPLTAGDVPVLVNAVTRVRWVPARAVFAIDAYVPASGWVEQARAGVFAFDSDGSPVQLNQLRAAAVMEWTPERGVVHARLASTGNDERAAVYLTLQRGWAGPRIEAYAHRASTSRPAVAVRVAAAEPGELTVQASDGTITSPNGTWDAQTVRATLPEPCLAITPPAPNLALAGAVLQTAVAVIGRDDSALYGGASRRALDFRVPAGTGYISLTLATGGRASAAADALALGRANLIDARQIPQLVTR